MFNIPKEWDMSTDIHVSMSLHITMSGTTAHSEVLCFRFKTNRSCSQIFMQKCSLSLTCEKPQQTQIINMKIWEKLGSNVHLSHMLINLFRFKIEHQTVTIECVLWCCRISDLISLAVASPSLPTPTTTLTTESR